MPAKGFTKYHFIDVEELRNLYCDLELTVRDIARLHEVPDWYVGKLLDEAGLWTLADSRLRQGRTGAETFRKYNSTVVYNIPKLQDLARANLAVGRARHPEAFLENSLRNSRMFFRVVYTDRNGRDHKLDSRWELAFALWLDDNELLWSSHPKPSIEYSYEGRSRHYHPDFWVEGDLVEIKGYWSSWDQIKIPLVSKLVNLVVYDESNFPAFHILPEIADTLRGSEVCYSRRA